MDNDENGKEDEEDDYYNIERRNTIHKLEDFVKNQKDKFKEEKEKESKDSKIPIKTPEDNLLLQKELRKSIVKPNLGKDKEIFKKLDQFIKIYNEKHKNINYEKMPDYLDKKEDDSRLIKSCKNEIYKHSIELPLIIFENKYFDEFSNFLDNYIKYKEYKVIYILKEKLLISKNKINNYEIFHKEKENKDEINNTFFAETILTSKVNLYSDEQIKEIQNSLGIMSKNFKENLMKEIEKWVATIFDIISDYILFKLKEKPLYYCCDICKMPILFKEKSIENIIENNEIENNNKTGNISDSDNIIINNQIIDKNEDNLKKNKIKKLIEEKKEKDKKAIKKIIKTQNDIIEYKNLFKAANNMISLIDFDKFITLNENHNLANPPKKKKTKVDKTSNTYNNLLYYTENKYADFEIFEREVSGAFILVTEKSSLEYVMKYLKDEGENNLNKFILLLSGNCCEKILQFLDENNYLNDFISCIIFTKNDKFNYLSNNYSKIKGIFKTKREVIDYLDNNEDQEKPYFTFKLINLKKYFDYYFEFHKKISEFYGQLSQNLFEKYINLLKEYLNQTSVDYTLIQALNAFQNGTEGKIDIIQGYTGNDYYSSFNKWLYSLDSCALEKTGYFLSGLSYSLDLYGEEEKTAVNKDITLYRGVALTYINILPYKNNIGNIITFPNFISSSTSLDVAKGFASMNCDSNQFEVIFTINYKCKDNWIPNAVYVDDISLFGGEEERLFQCYSFFKIMNVKINIDNKTADIELKTIGRTSILEEEIKNNKKIRYNYKEEALEAYS